MQLAAMFNSGQPMPKVCILSPPCCTCTGTCTVDSLLYASHFGTELGLMHCLMPSHTKQTVLRARVVCSNTKWCCLQWTTAPDISITCCVAQTPT
jgi:hypothetical protein